MKLRRWGAIALAAATAVGAMSGCTRLEEVTEANTVAATFGNEDIMLDYVMVQMRSTQYNYEAMFGSWYGTTDIWDQDMGDGTTMEETVINNVMQGIRQTYVLCDYAEKNGIALTDEQQAKVDEAVAKVMDGDQEYMSLVGITEDLMRKLYTQNALANVAYLQLVADVDTTIGDDEFINKDISYVKLTPVDLEEAAAETTEENTVLETEEVSAEETADETAEKETDEAETGEAETIEKETAAETTEAETTEKETAAETTEAETTKKETVAETATAESAEENTVSESEEAVTGSVSETEEVTTEEAMSEEEKAQLAAMESAADEISGRLADGESAADFVTEYNEDQTYFTATQSTSTVKETSSYAYTEAAFALSTGETAIYTDDSTGAIYVLYCTNDYDEDARNQSIESEIESRKSDLFAEKYADIQEDSPRFKIVEDVINAINFDTPLYVIPEETTGVAEPETVLETEAMTGEDESSDEAESETETAEAETAESEADTAAETTEAETTEAETTAK